MMGIRERAASFALRATPTIAIMALVLSVWTVLQINNAHDTIQLMQFKYLQACRSFHPAQQCYELLLEDWSNAELIARGHHNLR